MSVSDSLTAINRRRTIIARPLGIQEGVNFDKVEQKLVTPALRRLGITDAFTVAMGEHQSVPMAFFQQFLAAQLIVADISVHNPTLLHHLQIRESLQGRLAFLLCAKVSRKTAELLPHDCFVYDDTDPGASVDKLVIALYRKAASLSSDHLKFILLADCQAAVPVEFRQLVEHAMVAKQIGDLEFLASEIKGTQWENESMRLIGCAELALKSTLSKRVLLYINQTNMRTGPPAKYIAPGKANIVVQQIRTAINEELKLWGGIAFAIAGAESGEDIIFHEACISLGVPTTLYLPLPKEKFLASIKATGADWIERINHLEKELPSRVLADSEAPPPWLQSNSDYSIWHRGHYWMLHNALTNGGENLTLITSTNGDIKGSDSGNAELIEQASLYGAKIVIVDADEAFSIHNKNYRRYSSL